MIIDPEIIKRQRSLKKARYEKHKDKVILRSRERRLQNPSYYLWSKARTRARKLGLEFDIEPSDVVIPERCPILGGKLQPLSGNPNSSPSIDRLNCRKGYVKGNIAVISLRANTMKSDAELWEIKALYKWMKGVVDV